MLRPTRRSARTLAGVLATLFSVALLWPAAIVAGPATSGSAAAPSAAKSDRDPTIGGRGVKRFGEDRGRGPQKPLQPLAVDHTARESAHSGGRPSRAPDTTGVSAPDPVQATSSGAPAATSFGPWEGLDQATTGFEPPDPWVAVGPDDVVQSVNTRLRFTNREGAPRVPDIDVYDWFELASFQVGVTPLVIDGVGDPRWHYDVKHNRWAGLTMGWHCDDDGAGPDVSLGFVFGALSTTGDPTGDYYQFYVQYDFLPDFPMLGISGDKLTISANEYTFSGATNCTEGGLFDAATMTTFDWAAMLTYPAFPPFDYVFSFDHFALRPSVAPQGATNTIFVVGEALLADPPGLTTSNVGYMTITGTVASASGTILSTTLDLTNLGVVAPFMDPPPPVDPGGAFPATAVDRRPTDAIWQDNVLTFPSTYPCVPGGGGSTTRACARVTQLDTSTATPTRVQDLLATTTSRDTFAPGAGVSQSGTLHVVYSQSSSAEGVSSYDRYQLAGDAVHTLGAAREIADGGAIAYSGNRWGRFVGVAQDPRDTNAVWQGNQYTKSGGTWGTRVSEIQTAGSTFVPITPVRLLDSRSNIGTSGVFAHAVPKSVDIAGRGGIPDDAVAITGNLTVTGHTAGGYAALTQVPIANPATSTINFPVGDNRANNVTSPLSSIGGVSLTYRASAGKTTHFILDVTGYFLNDEVAESHTYNDIPPLRVLDTRFGTGLSGVFAANANRTFQVAGALPEIPITAKAITGNLTVTGQTAAGYVTLATDPPPTIPATSTINFPVGDTRANGVTIKLSATGELSAVYKAPPGKSTHLILDVTGYYLQDLNGARFVALTPGRRMDTRFATPQEGLGGPFTANVARTLIIEPYQGVPANATAISGNLTVVGQQRAGYVAMTELATNDPTTSTINFPLGDIRANGVTGPLSPAGSIGLVYEASGGLTHLILDLTGYFR